MVDSIGSDIDQFFGKPSQRMIDSQSVVTNYADCDPQYWQIVHQDYTVISPNNRHYTQKLLGQIKVTRCLLMDEIYKCKLMSVNNLHTFLSQIGRLKIFRLSFLKTLENKLIAIITKKNSRETNFLCLESLYIDMLIADPVIAAAAVVATALCYEQPNNCIVAIKLMGSTICGIKKSKITQYCTNRNMHKEVIMRNLICAENWLITWKQGWQIIDLDSQNDHDIEDAMMCTQYLIAQAPIYAECRIFKKIHNNVKITLSYVDSEQTVKLNEAGNGIIVNDNDMSERILWCDKLNTQITYDEFSNAYSGLVAIVHSGRPCTTCIKNMQSDSITSCLCGWKKRGWTWKESQLVKELAVTTGKEIVALSDYFCLAPNIRSSDLREIMDLQVLTRPYDQLKQLLKRQWTKFDDLFFVAGLTMHIPEWLAQPQELPKERIIEINEQSLLMLLYSKGSRQTTAGLCWFPKDIISSRNAYDEVDYAFLNKIIKIDIQKGLRTNIITSKNDINKINRLSKRSEEAYGIIKYFDDLGRNKACLIPVKYSGGDKWHVVDQAFSMQCDFSMCQVEFGFLAGNSTSNSKSIMSRCKNFIHKRMQSHVYFNLVNS